MTKNKKVLQGQVYGYLRVSTEEQNIENNKHTIQQKKDDLGLIGQIEWIDEKISGTIYWGKRELGKLINKMKEGDILIMSEISRIGRKSLEISEFLSVALRKGIVIHSLDIPKPIDGSLESMMYVNGFSFGAQMEREAISKRTKVALEKKKIELAKEGKQLGRPKGEGLHKLDPHKDKIKELIDMGVTLTRISDDYKVTMPTICNYVKKNNLKPSKRKIPDQNIK